jgi:TolB protein
MRRMRTLAVVLAAAALVLLTALALAAPKPPARHASLPAVSPDGRWIAFLSDRDSANWQLYVVGANGRDLTRLTNLSEQLSAPAWIDSNRIVFAVLRGDSAAVMTVAPSGGEPARFATVMGKSPAISRDGKQVAYTQGSWTRNQLVVATLPAGLPRVLSDSSQGGGFNLAWSPGDSLIAWTWFTPAQDLQIAVVDVATGHMRSVTHFPAADGRPQWPTWSPDGRTIVVQSGQYDRERPERSTAHLWRIDVATGAATKLAPHEQAWLDETPSFFPDGRRIAYQSTKSGRFELWVMNADGSGAKQLTH